DLPVSAPAVAGCSEQWESQDPAAPLVLGALVDPALVLPGSNAPPFWVAVWMAAVLFRQATRWPTLTVEGFGLNDMLPFSATIVIVTSAVPPPPPLGGGGFVTP